MYNIVTLLIRLSVLGMFAITKDISFKKIFNSITVGFFVGALAFLFLSESSKLLFADSNVKPIHSSKDIISEELKSFEKVNFADRMMDNISNIETYRKLSNVETISLEVESGDTIGKFLDENGILQTEINELVKALDGVFDISKLKPSIKGREGDKLMLKTSYVLDPENKETRKEIKEFSISRSPVEKILVRKTKDGFEAKKVEANIITKFVRKDGVIIDGQSLFTIGEQMNIPYNVLDQIDNVYSFSFDFGRDIHPGDTFTIMYEEKYSQNGEYLGGGDMIYANINTRGKEFPVYHFTNADGKSGYYNDKGEGTTKTIKKRPISARISSPYGMRRHPILGFTKKHTGVDFAAPSGTPIPAAGDGVVVYRGWKGGYGNYIKVRHNSTYSTAYAHLSKFRSNVRKGTRVKMGQTIGYVGSTGRSTGAHLHYEVIKNGVHINPLYMNLPPIANLKGDDLEKFMVLKDKVDLQFAVLGEDFFNYSKLDQ